jgi:hypothetical protein
MLEPIELPEEELPEVPAAGVAVAMAPPEVPAAGVAVAAVAPLEEEELLLEEEPLLMPLKLKACQGTRTWFPPVVLPVVPLLPAPVVAAGVPVAAAPLPEVPAAGVAVAAVVLLEEEPLLELAPATLTTT